MVRAVSSFQQLVNPASIVALEAELDVDQKRFGELFTEYGRMREELEALRESIEHQEKVIEAIRGALPSNGSPGTHGSGSSGDAAMTKREIATEVLRGSLQPLFPREVREIAVKRGWISADRASANQLSVAMAKGARAGVFLKDRKGRYRLPE